MNTPQPTIDFSEMPQMFGRCLCAACPLADKCLRQLAWRQEETRGDWLTVLNPHTVKGGPECPHFIDAFHPAYAKGLRFNLDDVPLGKARALRSALTEALGRMKLSRMRRGLLPISPEQQRWLADIFARHGAPAPEYEAFVHPWSLY